MAGLKGFWLAGAVAALVATTPAAAQDKLTLAIGQRGNWDSGPSDLGQQAGFFKKQNLQLDILYTQGTGETIQAVIAGSADLGVAVGTAGALAAFAKGAPIRAIAAQSTGATDTFWYVRAESPLKSIRETEGKTVAFSANGSSTHNVVLGFARHFKVNLKPVSTGNAASTFTQVMSGQIDVGWSSPPFGLDALADNRIRIVGRGSEIPGLQQQTVRLIVVNARALEQKRDAIARYMRAYRETVDWMYSDPAALKAYSDWVKIPVDLVKRLPTDFYPKAMLDPSTVTGIDLVMADAVDGKYIPAPIAKDRLDEFFKPVAELAR